MAHGARSSAVRRLAHGWHVDPWTGTCFARHVWIVRHSAMFEWVCEWVDFQPRPRCARGADLPDGMWMWTTDVVVLARSFFSCLDDGVFPGIAPQRQGRNRREWRFSFLPIGLHIGHAFDLSLTRTDPVRRYRFPIFGRIHVFCSGWRMDGSPISPFHARVRCVQSCLSCLGHCVGPSLDWTFQPLPQFLSFPPFSTNRDSFGRDGKVRSDETGSKRGRGMDGQKAWDTRRGNATFRASFEWNRGDGGQEKNDVPRWWQGRPHPLVEMNSGGTRGASDRLLEGRNVGSGGRI